MNASPALAAARVGLSPTSCPNASTYCTPAVCASCAPAAVPASRIAPTLLLLSKNSSATTRRSRAAAAGLAAGFAASPGLAAVPAARRRLCLRRFPARPLRDQARLQRAAHLGGAREPAFGILREAAHDRFLERDRDRRPPRQRRRPAAAVILLHLDGVAPERRRPRQHLVEHHPQRIDVAARVDVGARLALLGRHVFGRAGRRLFFRRFDAASPPLPTCAPGRNRIAWRRTQDR